MSKTLKTIINVLIALVAAAAVYCVAMLLCKRFGIDTGKLPNPFKQNEEEEIAAAMEEILEGYEPEKSPR